MLPVTVATFVKVVDAAAPLATDAVYVSETVVPVGTAPISQLIRVPDAQVGPSAVPLVTPGGSAPYAPNVRPTGRQSTTTVSYEWGRRDSPLTGWPERGWSR